MGEIKLSMLVRAGLFAIGMAMILVAFSNIMMSAAYLTVHGLMGFDYGIFSQGVAIVNAIIAFIGSLLVFLGWNAESPNTDRTV
ncbi:MAG: hypothetical protein ACFFEU_15710 [Candidatus Thorarchaeota archaeon]|jgi:hypothetical protein